jgi:butyryl-CoA dehydrogenase
VDAGQRLRATLDFLLYDWLGVERLSERARYAEHSRETFDAVLQTCERIARERYEPYNRLVDTQEPRFDGERVVLPQAAQDALDAYVASGMLSASQDHSVGGMQLPFVVEAAANAFFSQASVSINTALLTVGNANLLMAHGSELQKQVFAGGQWSGRWSGTMCLSEPQAGSSLGDITTRALPDNDDGGSDALGPRYRLYGSKMWISAGDHELTENIVHLVLAKIPDEQGRLPPGVKGISLFIVPKHLVDAQGQLTGQRNDVVLVGLNHKLGWRGGIPGWRAGPGSGLHVPHDERGAHWHRHGRCHAGHGRLPRQPELRPAAPARPAPGRQLSQCVAGSHHRAC